MQVSFSGTASQVREQIKEAFTLAEPQPSIAIGAAEPSSLPPLIGEISAFIAKREKIQAIKRVREVTGLGLKESKDFVDVFCILYPDARY